MNPLIRELDEYWRDLARDGAPERRDVDPIKLRHILPYVIIAEAIFAEPLRIRYRLVGSALEAISPLRAGQYLDQYFSGPNEAANRELLTVYQKVMRSGQPISGVYTYRDPKGRTYDAQWAIFPLAVERVIRQFIAIEDCRLVPTIEASPLETRARSPRAR